MSLPTIATDGASIRQSKTSQTASNTCGNCHLPTSGELRGIQLWNRTSGGIVVAHTPLDLIRAMSVDSSWIMRWRVYADRVEYSLSHHDAPMGSASKLTPLPIEDVYVLE